MFWRRWLTLWCAGVGVFGLVLYGVGFAATTAPAAAVFALLGNPLPLEPDRYLRFATSLMGAVSLGWAMTLYVACRAAWRLTGAASVAAWRGLTLAAFVWFVIDSNASIANGFPLNAVSNTGLLVLFLIPLLASRVLSAVPAAA